ncbi:MAG: adenylyl-sulfate kinase [Bacteroidia bacterium]|nr:adenylyl-sulfate kinase [Bacteroidia bacterium]
MKTPENIHPVFDQILTRAHKEQLLNQRSKVVWFTGLSGAGKTTLAKGLEKNLHNEGYLAQVLDGDNIRTGINNNLGFSEADRLENIRRISEVSKLLMNSGIITLNSFISPTRKIRHLAMDIIGRENFIEVFVDAPIAVCEQRDIKGLYKKAREGKIKNFTGIDSPFEVPLNADLVVNTAEINIKKANQLVLAYVLPKIEYRE